MERLPALIVPLDAVKNDGALREGGRGARKIVVTARIPATETEACEVIWTPPSGHDPCAVQLMKDTEVAYFTQAAPQDSHLHKLATEMYMVIEGEMVIEVEGSPYRLMPGDMMIVNPGTVHEVRPEGTEFLCRVVTTNCGGPADKYRV